MIETTISVYLLLGLIMALFMQVVLNRRYSLWFILWIMLSWLPVAMLLFCLVCTHGLAGTDRVIDEWDAGA